MKSKYLLYGLFTLALLFAAGTATLFYLQRPSDTASSPASGWLRSADSVAARSSPLPNGAGKALILYTGDILGSLDPCG
jgi:hypothetical protein